MKKIAMICAVTLECLSIASNVNGMDEARRGPNTDPLPIFWTGRTDNNTGAVPTDVICSTSDEAKIAIAAIAMEDTELFSLAMRSFFELNYGLDGQSKEDNINAINQLLSYSHNTLKDYYICWLGSEKFDDDCSSFLTNNIERLLIKETVINITVNKVSILPNVINFIKEMKVISYSYKNVVQRIENPFENVFYNIVNDIFEYQKTNENVDNEYCYKCTFDDFIQHQNLSNSDDLVLSAIDRLFHYHVANKIQANFINWMRDTFRDYPFERFDHKLKYDFIYNLLINYPANWLQISGINLIDFDNELGINLLINLINNIGYGYHPNLVNVFKNAIQLASAEDLSLCFSDDEDDVISLLGYAIKHTNNTSIVNMIIRKMQSFSSIDFSEIAKNGLDIASKRIESIEDYRDKILEEYQKYETNYQSAKCELTRNFAERRMAQKKNEHNELGRDIEAFQNYQRQISILIH